MEPKLPNNRVLPLLSRFLLTQLRILSLIVGFLSTLSEM